jgi:hypothetical protein
LAFHTGVAGCLVAAGLLSREAAAQTACNSLPNVVYMQVGDTQLNLMKALGRKLRDNTPFPITIAFITSGSCTNIQAVYTDVPITANLQYIPSVAEDPTWTQTSATLPCTPPAGGAHVDVGISATFVSSCTSDPPPAGIKNFVGPVQAYVFAVPELSTQKAITAEEAFFAFGVGQTANIDPWNDETQMFIRTVTKSTILTMSAAIDVPAAKWKGVRFDGSPMVVSSLEMSMKPEAAIGILGAEVYDGARKLLNELAFKSFGQRYAYYADSTANTLDKRNVRDGHYTPWAPIVLMAHTDGGGAVTPALSKYIVDLVTTFDGSPKPNFDPLGTVAGVNLIPECAMSVKRDFEGGDLSLYSPDVPCGCFFEGVTGGKAPASCTSCTDDKPCGSGKCRFGYCEAR